MEKIYLNQNDVLSVDNPINWVVLTDTTFKVGAFLAKMKSSVQGDEKPFERIVWARYKLRIVASGVLTGKKVKLKFAHEFCPDQPESPLDDIHQAINEAEILE